MHTQCMGKKQKSLNTTVVSGAEIFGGASDAIHCPPGQFQSRSGAQSSCVLGIGVAPEEQVKFEYWPFS